MSSGDGSVQDGKIAFFSKKKGLTWTLLVWSSLKMSPWDVGWVVSTICVSILENKWLIDTKKRLTD